MSMAPRVETIDEDVNAAATAATEATVLGRAPFAGTITAVRYSPEGTITGVNTNTRRVRLFNRGQDGNGNVAVADLQFNSGTNADDFDERTIPITGSAVVAEGDVLEWRSEAVGTGLADPGGKVAVDVSRTG
jgi:hypothetical protein